MEEVKNEVIEEIKKYTFRRLEANDIFTMVNIVSKIGVNKFAQCFKSDDIKTLVKDMQNKKEVKAEDISLIVGGSIFLEIAQVILEGMPKCKDDIFKLLSDTSNLSLEELKTLDGVTFFEMIIDFVKKEEFMDFIKAVSRLVTKGK